MKKIIFVVIAATFLLLSCQSLQKHIFSFENNSSRMIDSVKVYSSVAEITLANIKPSESQSKIYTIAHESNHDGAFRAFIYFSDTTVMVPSFGYYSNDRDVANYLSLEIDKNLIARQTK